MKNHHLVLLGDNYTHTNRVIRYACKIAGKSLVIFSQVTPPDNSVVLMDIEHCKEEDIEELRSIIKLKNCEKYEGL